MSQHTNSKDLTPFLNFCLALLNTLPNAKAFVTR